MDKKKYQSVAEMTRALADDDQLANELEERINERQIVKKLAALRLAKGMSQTEIAAAMQCTQSRISKLESGVDRDLTLGDLELYLDALGLAAGIVMSPKGQTAAAAIKHHWDRIGQHLNNLVELANPDSEIAIGVAKFSQTITCN